MSDADEGKAGGVWVNGVQASIEGGVWVVPKVHRGMYGRAEVDVWIGGDPKGLRSLAESLVMLADLDQQKASTPTGERAHFHLMPRYNYGFCGELGADSCCVEVSRIDASGTGEIYPHLLAAERDLVGFRPDTTPPSVWLQHAEASFELLRSAAVGSDFSRQHVPALAGQLTFCCLMAVLRSRGVTVPEDPEYISTVSEFLPGDLSLPVPLRKVDTLLSGDMPRPEGRWRHPATEPEIRSAVKSAERILVWAKGQLEADEQPRQD